jgi:nucleotide-binding universal stress UspA family protein
LTSINAAATPQPILDGTLKLRRGTMRILLAVDGSHPGNRAARFVVKLSSGLVEKPRVTLLYVDEPLLRSVTVELGAEGTARYHAENGRYALRLPKAALKRGDVDFEEQMLIGDPAEMIVKVASASRSNLIVMGSHGRSAFQSVFLGSVTIKVLTHTETPVTIIR